MSHWYPTQGRADALSSELERLEKLSTEHLANPAKFLGRISETLVSARQKPNFPQHQIGNWVWVSSQYRLLAGTKAAGELSARAALTFLAQRIQQAELVEADTQDLNWVLDATIRKLNKSARPDTLRSGLSGSEILAIEARLAHFATESQFDPIKIRLQIQEQVKEFAEFSTDGRFNSILEKLECLLEASNNDTPEGRAARSALLYLAEKDDVVSDELGVLGLLDDVYVIDWAYAVITHQTRCLPILESFVERWPFVADLAILGEELQQLDHYSQYVACACLHQLFGSTEATLFIVRESAGFGIISAFMAAVQCARLHSDALEREICAWSDGQPVVIGDGHEQFRALFHGVANIGGKSKIWLGVRGGRMTVDANVMPYIARAPSKDKILSEGSRISAWLKQRHLDPLVGLTGNGRRSLEKQECILLLGPKNKLDTYFGELRPFGLSAAALVGARYVAADLNSHPVGRQVSDTPYIYACSDANTALDLIQNPPEHVAGWKVIVDGARNGRTLLSSLKGSNSSGSVSLCILGELHEREWSTELARQGVPVWYLEARDVQTLSPARQLQRTDDDLLRSITRQGGYKFQRTRISEVRSEFLELVAACLRDRADAKDQNSQMFSLDMALSSFLQKAISVPFRDHAAHRELDESARRIASHASVLGRYDARAARIVELFKAYSSGDAVKFERQSQIASLVNSIPQSKSVAVVCRSVPGAIGCKHLASARPNLRRVLWTTMAGVRKLAPFDHLIVPGWLDRLSMREIANNGYSAELDLVLFPFEERWFSATVAANDRWEGSLQAKTAAVLRKIVASTATNHGKGRLWRQQAEERLLSPASEAPKNPTTPISDVPEYELLEARAIEALRNDPSLSRPGQITAKAQLVLFEADGAYAYLPPDGRAIVLSDADTQLNRQLISQGAAESLLFRSVATLKPGMVLAFSEGTDRDLIDARADQFLSNSQAVRATAGLWKVALKSAINGRSDGYSDFAQKMAAAGHARHPLTVRSWVTGTQSVAPKKYKTVVPLIARLTGDVKLGARLQEVLSSIDLIYRARNRAAEAIVNELLSGEIDLNSETLNFDLNGVSIQYNLHRVRRIAGIQEVPIELIGKPQTIAGISNPQTLFDMVH